jgi:two-component system phosphate regulon response regulator PhoB
MRRILLVDDDENVRLLLRTTLEDEDVEIHEACDGTEGLGLAVKLRPDLILLVWMLPGRSGIEVVRRLRQNPAHATTYIILLTAKGSDEDRELGLASGADDFLAKPFSPLELLKKIERLLG